MEARLGVGNAVEQCAHRPARRLELDGHVLLVRQHVEHLTVAADFVAAAAEVERQQVGRRAAESDAVVREQHRAAELLS